MRIEKYICPGCGKEHERKLYESQSEGVADVFIELWFPIIWEKKKNRIKEVGFEDFCKELVFMSIYNYHKNRRRIRVEKSCVQPSNRTEDSRD